MEPNTSPQSNREPQLNPIHQTLTGNVATADNQQGGQPAAECSPTKQPKRTRTNTAIGCTEFSPG